jgi:hypothetical protein
MRAITANALDRSLDIAATLEVRGYGSAPDGRGARAGPGRVTTSAFACSAAAIAVSTWRSRCRRRSRSTPRSTDRFGVATWALCGALRSPCSRRSRSAAGSAMNALELEGVTYSYPGSPSAGA